MGLVIEDDLLESTRMSESEIRLELAIALYQLDKFTLGQAARLAVLSQSRMRHALAARGIGPHYGVDDVEHDRDTQQRSA